jgi:hypothetical protein
MICNSLLHLLSHPAQPGLVNHPGLLPHAVAESVRLEPAAAVGACGGPASRAPAVRRGAPLAGTSRSSSLVPAQAVFTDAGRIALAGFLTGYQEACTLDLRQSHRHDQVGIAAAAVMP